MDFVLEKGSTGFEEGFRELLSERGYACKGGICVRMKTEEGSRIRVSYGDGSAEIAAPAKAFAFRGLAQLVMRLERDGEAVAFSLEEEVHFEENGTMVDCSRNCVMSVEAVKAWIRMQAAVGMNILMLYTEDTYEVPEYPYFGAFRGRYKKEELREMDSYAQMFGIELIPCIQTLGHLQHPMRWEGMEELRDTSDIVLVGDEKVYAFLRACMKQVSECFTTRRVHLGMDEAWTLGLGRYLIKNGYHAKSEIIEEHLNRVMEICRELGLEPMIWSDMYLRIHSPNEEYYNVPFDADMTTKAVPPEGMALVYWDYYHMDEAFYRSYIRLHRQLTDQVIVAGGAWTWNGLVPNIRTGYAVTRAALHACRAEQVKCTICTLWGDDGTETPLFAGIGPVLLYAEYGFGEIPDEHRVKEKFEFLTGCSYARYLALGEFDYIQEGPDETSVCADPSKSLFYQDVLAGMYDGQLENIMIGNYYAELEKKMCRLEEAWDGVKAAQRTFWGGEMRAVLKYYEALAHALSCKADLGLRIRAAYLSGDRETLREIAERELPQAIRCVDRCRILRENIWMAEGRMLGWEVLDIRFRALSGRMESAVERLEQYLDGRTDTLPEVEEPRVKFFPSKSGKERLRGYNNSWINVVSASPLAWRWMPN